MQNNSLHTSAILLCITLAQSQVATANERITVAMAASTSSGLYSGDSAEFGLVPYLAYDRGNLHIAVDGLHYRVAEGDALSLSIGFAPRFGPDFPDTALFAGLDRDDTIEATLKGSFQLTSGVELSAGLKYDILSEHGGYEANLTVGRSVPLSGVIVESQLGFRHRSSDLNDYLVGVSPSEVNSGRSAYSPGATTSPFATLSLTLPVSERTALVGNASFDYFGDAYRDSPLVSKRWTTSIGLGVAHSF